MIDRIANTSATYLIVMVIVLALLMTACPRALLKKRRQAKAKGTKPKWLGIAVSLWFCLTFLAWVEFLFAMLYDTTDSFSMTNASRRWFKIHVEPDQRVLKFADGTAFEYRDNEAFPETLADQNQRHIVFFGDSFTYGHGVADVNDRFSNVVRRALTDTGIRVTNVSKPGTDLNWAAAQLEQIHSNDLPLDTAVYVMCLNDIEAFHDPRMQKSIELSHFEPPTLLFRDTYFFNWLYFRVQQLSNKGVRSYYSFVKDYYAGEPWRRFLRKLDEVHEECRSNNTEFIVVLFPFLHSLGREYPFAEIHSQIENACQERGIPCIDLLRPLSDSGNSDLVVNAFDAHPNEQAHFIAAKAILPSLSNRKADR